MLPYVAAPLLSHSEPNPRPQDLAEPLSASPRAELPAAPGAAANGGVPLLIETTPPREPREPFSPPQGTQHFAFKDVRFWINCLETRDCSLFWINYLETRPSAPRGRRSTTRRGTCKAPSAAPCKLRQRCTYDRSVAVGWYRPFFLCAIFSASTLFCARCFKFRFGIKIGNK